MDEYFCFITDNDGFWYFIPVNQRDNFTSCLEDMESDPNLYIVFIKNFERYRSLHPVNYMFPSLSKKVLKG
jgi:hypothetical protein